MIYLLDSNVWIALLRRSSALLAIKFQAVASTADLRICSVVKAELWHGAIKSAKPVANRRDADALIAPFPRMPFDDVAAEHFLSFALMTFRPCALTE
jgi:tRNA(fMet)-specific endonuclease VapC